MSTVEEKQQKPSDVKQQDEAARAEKRLATLQEAGQWKLIWIRFKKHRIAVVSGILLILLYSAALFAPFVAPYDPHTKDSTFNYAPPTRVRLFHNGSFYGPFVYPYEKSRDPDTFRISYTEDTNRPTRIRLFVRGAEYEWLGAIRSSLHLFGTADPAVKIFLFGSDNLGRDMFTRTLFGSRISLTIGLVGIAISLFLGILIGGLAGYYGGGVDMVTQRIIEILQAIPGLPLWMALSAALPAAWGGLQRYFAITVILSILGWTGLARVVRGKFLSLRDEDFVLAARFAGRNQVQIIFIHMLPSFISYLIASLTLAIPGMILGETSLSFLGLGLQAPMISWGVMLQQAQNVSSVALAPWLMIPGLFVVFTVLAFNFFGDGLRDAADPYA